MDFELPSLSVSVVAYRPNESVLADTLNSLVRSIEFALESKVLGYARVDLIDNNEKESPFDFSPMLKTFETTPKIRVQVISGHGNLGYGCGHNLSILKTGKTFHLVLNPDVILAPDAIFQAIGFMQSNDRVGLISPSAQNGTGEVEYLCKRFPTLLDLALRGFAPHAVKKVFDARMAKYELRNQIEQGRPFPVEIVSGCFMFWRTPLLKQIGGFSAHYFMYFEDFDVSLRASACSILMHVPSVQVIHFGGAAARKGIKHILMFVKSAAVFYKRNGLKLF